MQSLPIRLATRGSALARAQAQSVADRLGVPCEMVIVSTSGDRRHDEPIWRMGGRGVFVKEVQEAVLDGRADAAVHSAKDLPSTTPPGLTLAAFPERLDPRDVIVGQPFTGLPTGSTVATGSVRRRSQIAWLRPDVAFAPLRGSIETRLQKSRRAGAGIVARAALLRMGLEGEAAEILDPSVVLPQAGQGAIAVECLADDDDCATVLDGIDDLGVRLAVTAERAFLAELGGGCNLPAGALAELAGELIVIEVLIASLDGRVVLRRHRAGADPETVGREAARELIDECGGRSLLEASGPAALEAEPTG